MNELFERQHRKLEQWSVAAHAEGWISERDTDRLKQVERQQAEALFARKGQRPLVVAFFGGTGVGKSSLLNRLAGEEIARTGVERPTSHEVTLFLHGDYRLAEFPADLPLNETRIAYHSDDRRRLIAWLDMPDFDSVEEHHRDLVRAWLPYIDWLIYVVSPGRYQDDIGWRFVQQRGGKHSWLFVMNQWDQGHQQQIDHFRLRLQQEGFSDPVILRTSCVGPGNDADDFGSLEKTINDAIETYGLELLQQLGVQARLDELLKINKAFVDQLQGYQLSDLEKPWQELQSHVLHEVKRDLLTNASLLARRFQQEGGLPWKETKKAAAVELSGAQPKALLTEMWSQRAGMQLNDLSSELENLLLQRNIPSTPFRLWLERLRDSSKVDFLEAAEPACAKALLLPGSALRRGVCRLMGWLSWILPLAASTWVIYHLVVRFHLGTRGEAQFLGLDFAIHSGLLIVLSWLLPWLLQRKLRPGPAETVLQALVAGIDAGLKRFGGQGVKAVAAAVESRKNCISGAVAIYEELSACLESSSKSLPWSS